MRLAWGAGGAFAAAIGFFVAACGSSDDDGGNPVEAGVTDDGGALPDTAAPPDAGADAAGDATKDAPVDAPDAGPGFCASLVPAPRFCADFDDADPGAAWTTKTDLAGYSTVGIDMTVSRSAPASLRGESRALGAGEPGNASLRKTLLDAATHVTLAFSAKWSATSFADGTLAVANVDVAQNRFYTLHFRDDEGNASFEEISGATTTRTKLVSVPAPNTWTRIVIDLDLANGKATVTADGTKIVDATITAAAASEVTIRIGNVYVAGPLPKLTTNVDDVVLDY